MKNSVLSMSVLVASSYLLLSVASMVCVIDSDDRHAAGHHQGGKLPHSSSCAWACQANPASGFISSGLPLVPVFAVALLHLTQEIGAPSPSDHFSVSRGPPPPAFLLS